jgi:predicted permease
MFRGALRVPGRPQSGDGNRTITPIGVVSEDYFRAMGIPLREGRNFDERDNPGSPSVVILSASLARALFPNENALGKQVWMPGSGKDTPTVIGIVGDVKHQGLDQDVSPQAYVPYRQSAVTNAMTIVVRTTGNPMTLASAVRNQLLAVDRDLPVAEMQTMEQRLANSVSSRRFNLVLLGLFSLLALTLAAVGVYGVVAYVAAQRTREIGVRMALGARRRDVLELILRQEMKFAGVGVLVGLAGAFAATRLLGSLLFGVSPNDPVTFVAAPLLLVTVALLACLVPALRAARIDPWAALRSE